MEAAERSSKAFKGTESALQKLSIRSSRAPCYRCGRSNHDANDCKFKDTECHNCHKKGHIAPACRSKLSKKQSGKNTGKFKGNTRARQQTKWINADDGKLIPDAEDLNKFTIGEKSSRPIFVDVKVNGKPLTMEVDTGAAVTVISDEMRKSKFPDVPLRKSSVILRTYTGQQMCILGKCKSRYSTRIRRNHCASLLCLVMVPVYWAETG